MMNCLRGTAVVLFALTACSGCEENASLRPDGFVVVEASMPAAETGVADAAVVDAAVVDAAVVDAAVVDAAVVDAAVVDAAVVDAAVVDAAVVDAAVVDAAVADAAVADAPRVDANTPWDAASPADSVLEGAPPADLPTPTVPCNYYVKNSGDDQASGLSDQHAWKTIAKVNSFSFVDGDTVCFKRGDTFADKTLLSPDVDNFTFQDYGTGAKPLLDGDQKQPINISPSTPIKNLTIRNLDISGQDWSLTKSSNLRVNNVIGVTIEAVEGDGHAGGNTSDGKTAITILNSEGPIVVRDCVLFNWGPTTMPQLSQDFMGISLLYIHQGTYEIHDNTIHNVNADCIHLYHSTAVGRVHHNVLYNAGEDGIDYKGSENIEIDHNEFFRTPDFTGQGGTGSGGLWTGIVVHEAGGLIARNGNIHDNFFHDGDNVGIKLGNAETIEIAHNVFQRCQGSIYLQNNVLDAKIHHNIFSETQKRAVIYENNSAGGTEIYNNTFYSAGGTAQLLVHVAYGNATSIYQNVVYHDMNSSSAYALLFNNAAHAAQVHHNCWFNSNHSNRVKTGSLEYSATMLASWQQAGHPGAVFADPQLILPAQGNFGLDDSSPCQADGIKWGALP